MDISIVLKDGSYAACGDVDAVILLEDHSWVMKQGVKRVESEFRIQIDDYGDGISFSGLAYGEDLGHLNLPKRPPRF